MTLLFGYVISGIILAILITIFAEIDVTEDIMRPIGIILISSVFAIIPRIFLNGVLGVIVSLLVYLIAIYFLLDFFYTLEGYIKKKIMIYFIAIKVLWIVFIYTAVFFMY